MGEASTFFIYAKKAVRDLAAEQQNFYEEGQNSSAFISMQNGAVAGASAVETALQKQPADINSKFELQMSEARLTGKRKAGDNELLQVAERKLALTERFMTCMERFDPKWRDDMPLQMKAREWLLNTLEL
jgi:hypothetical protein